MFTHMQVCEGELSAQLQEAAAAPAVQLAALLCTAAAAFGSAPGGAPDAEPSTPPWLAAALAVALRSAERCCTHIHTSPSAVQQACIGSVDWLHYSKLLTVSSRRPVQGTEAATCAATAAGCPCLPTAPTLQRAPAARWRLRCCGRCMRRCRRQCSCPTCTQRRCNPHG